MERDRSDFQDPQRQTAKYIVFRLWYLGYIAAPDDFKAAIEFLQAQNNKKMVQDN